MNNLIKNKFLISCCLFLLMIQGCLVGIHAPYIIDEVFRITSGDGNIYYAPQIYLSGIGRKYEGSFFSGNPYEIYIGQTTKRDLSEYHNQRITFEAYSFEIPGNPHIKYLASSVKIWNGPYYPGSAHVPPFFGWCKPFFTPKMASQLGLYKIEPYSFFETPIEPLRIAFRTYNGRQILLEHNWEAQLVSKEDQKAALTDFKFKPSPGKALLVVIRSKQVGGYMFGLKATSDDGQKIEGIRRNCYATMDINPGLRTICYGYAETSSSRLLGHGSYDINLLAKAGETYFSHVFIKWGGNADVKMLSKEDAELIISKASPEQYIYF